MGRACFARGSASVAAAGPHMATHTFDAWSAGNDYVMTGNKGVFFFSAAHFRGLISLTYWVVSESVRKDGGERERRRRERERRRKREKKMEEKRREKE